MIPIGWAVSLALKAGVSEKAAKPVAIGALIVIAGLALWGGISAYNSEIIQNALNEANVEFLEEKDVATGKADAASAERKTQVETEIKKTEELIDEALEKGCVVADYLHSRGAVCVRP